VGLNGEAYEEALLLELSMKMKKENKLFASLL